MRKLASSIFQASLIKCVHSRTLYALTGFTWATEGERVSRRGQSHLTLGGLITCLRRFRPSFTRGHGSTAGSRLSIPSFLGASALTFILWQIPLPECFNKMKEVFFNYLQLFFFSLFFFGPSHGYPFPHFFSPLVWLSSWGWFIWTVLPSLWESMGIITNWMIYTLPCTQAQKHECTHKQNIMPIT